MPEVVRLVHSLVGPYHITTSPDVRGFNVSADSHSEVQRVAISVLDALVARRGWEKPVVVFEELADAA